MSNTDVRKIRAGLKHPIIDADGHWAEFHPHMRQEFKRIGGNIAVEVAVSEKAPPPPPSPPG